MANEFNFKYVPGRSVGQHIMDYKLAKPGAKPAEIAEWIVKHVPGSKTSAASVLCVLNRASKNLNNPKLHTSYHGDSDQTRYVNTKTTSDSSGPELNKADLLNDVVGSEPYQDPLEAIKRIRSGYSAASPIVDRSGELKVFEAAIRERMIGQDAAVEALVEQYTLRLAGATPAGRPIANMFLLGPTGVGKTLLCESLAHALHGDTKKMVKIDCGEFQLEHEIAKLIGAPPGYIGHDNAEPRLSQKSLNAMRSAKCQDVVILFDEIEKAHESVYRILLAIMDKGSFTLNNGQHVDMSNCWIMLTSNVGAREIASLVGKPADVVDKIAREALKVKFSPEFIGRVDIVTVFRMLTDAEFKLILEKELAAIGATMKVSISLTDRAAREILAAVVDKFYGARSMKQGLRKHVSLPAARRMLSGEPINEIKIDWKNGKAVVA